MAELTGTARRAAGGEMRMSMAEVFVMRDGKIAERRAWVIVPTRMSFAERTAAAVTSILPGAEPRPYCLAAAFHGPASGPATWTQHVEPTRRHHAAVVDRADGVIPGMLSVSSAADGSRRQRAGATTCARTRCRGALLGRSCPPACLASARFSRFLPPARLIRMPDMNRRGSCRYAGLNDVRPAGDAVGGGWRRKSPPSVAICRASWRVALAKRSGDSGERRPVRAAALSQPPG